MPFKPIHGDHAILEVVFQVTLDRPFLRPEIQALAAEHAMLAEELPSARVVEQFQPVVDATGGEVFVSLPQVGQAPTATPILEFSAFRRDGNIEWRLQCAGPFVTVNCTTYTRWERVWGRACHYLSFALSKTGAEPRKVQHLLLQYIDLFTWRGARDGYRASELLDLASPLFPASLEGRGPIWHLHQGWFSDPSTTPGASARSPAGRVLERFHLDSVEGMVAGQSESNPSVRIDNLIRYDLTTPVEVQGLFSGNGVGLTCFEVMHQLNKQRLREALSRAAAEEIGLGA